MARSKLTNPENDLISDSGSVLWSFVKGEQLEFAVTMNFVSDATLGYTYEAVVIEGLNVVGQDAPPTGVLNGGVQTRLTVRVPVKRGTWSAITAYNKEEVVIHNNVPYRLLGGASRVSGITPDLDPYWQATTLNRVYIQFPNALGASWQVQPSIGSAAYGFFELRVTEPSDIIFSRTWKPVRGMVELLFSPTDAVTDV